MSRVGRLGVAAAVMVGIGSVVAVALGAALAISRLAGPPLSPVPCPRDVVAVQVFNTYADHVIADRQDVSGEVAATACQIMLVDSAIPQTFRDADLGRAKTTVISFTSRDATVTTAWVYQLVAPLDGTAIVLSTGESFRVPNVGKERYLAPDSTVIPRSEVPAR